MGKWGIILVTSGLALGVSCLYLAIHSIRSNKRKQKIPPGAVPQNGVSVTWRIIVLGLVGSGKSSFISRLSKVDKEKRKVQPTQGFNVLCLQTSGLTYNIWEIGGQMKSYWTNFIEEANVLVFVVDSADESKFDEAVTEFNKIIVDKRLSQTSVLLLANKQDVPGAKSPMVVEKLFECDGGFVKGHPVRCLGTRAPFGVSSHSSISEAERLMLTLCQKHDK